ncbi:hypothetical protein DMA11_18275 [Marinilabiliaceae bacterium JC017]|nr:hypothetical protein DMA11_18275 [Marinilabiliaceae bacterium JC017]
MTGLKVALNCKKWMFDGNVGVVSRCFFRKYFSGGLRIKRRLMMEGAFVTHFCWNMFVQWFVKLL